MIQLKKQPVAICVATLCLFGGQLAECGRIKPSAPAAAAAAPTAAAKPLAAPQAAPQQAPVQQGFNMGQNQGNSMFNLIGQGINMYAQQKQQGNNNFQQAGVNPQIPFGQAQVPMGFGQAQVPMGFGSPVNPQGGVLNGNLVQGQVANQLSQQTDTSAVIQSLLSSVDALQRLSFEREDALARFVPVTELSKHLRAMLDTIKGVAAKNGIGFDLDKLTQKLIPLSNCLYLFIMDSNGAAPQATNAAAASKEAPKKPVEETVDLSMYLERVELIIGLFRKITNQPVASDIAAAKETVKSMLPELNQLIQQVQQCQFLLAQQTQFAPLQQPQFAQQLQQPQFAQQLQQPQFAQQLQQPQFAQQLQQPQFAQQLQQPQFAQQLQQPQFAQQLQQPQFAQMLGSQYPGNIKFP
ncbi:MAG: hypothetical protein LBJ89_01285 [Holosporales bacterium]|jgi:hypothetical protein|nr:hypothetical protein [Holosporales bacterium]